MIASPTAASAAATAITKKTNTCPPTPRRCASATNVRFTALSISSTHMKITIALRRSRTPVTPSVKSTAEMTRAGSSSTLEFPLRQHHRADDRGEEEQAGDLERDQIGVEQGAGDRRHHALLLHRRHRALGELNGRGGRRVAQHAQLQQQRAGEQGADPETHGSLQVGRPGAPQVEQHDHEEEQHHDGAGVDEHLQHRDELRVEQHEQAGQREQRDDEPERARDGIPAGDAEQGAEHRDDAKNPEERQRTKHLRDYSPFGSDGSHSVETGWVWAVRRSRSYTKRSREYSEFS